VNRIKPCRMSLIGERALFGAIRGKRYLSVIIDMSPGVQGWFCLATESYWICYLFLHLFGIKEGGSVVSETAVMSEPEKDWTGLENMT